METAPAQTFEERFKQRFPLYHVQAPKASQILAYVAAEREQAGAEGIILGASYERNTLFEIITKTDAKGSPAKFKTQLLEYLSKEEPQSHEDTPA